MPRAQAYYIDAAVAEPSNPAVGYAGRSIEERVSLLEGTITNQDRVFDMLREGQQNLMVGIVRLRDDMDKRFGEVDTRISETNERITAMELGVNGRIADMGVRLNTKIDSNLKWMLGVQIVMWVTIIVAVLL
ncbi:MAG: hypothetical protein U9N46_04360 [Euryarchaeota archaeon]|nr:hypothetical protein [Euryarchaeota archaeon]